MRKKRYMYIFCALWWNGMLFKNHPWNFSIAVENSWNKNKYKFKILFWLNLFEFSVRHMSFSSEFIMIFFSQKKNAPTPETTGKIPSFINSISHKFLFLEKRPRGIGLIEQSSVIYFLFSYENIFFRRKQSLFIFPKKIILLFNSHPNTCFRRVCVPYLRNWILVIIV